MDERPRSDGNSQPVGHITALLQKTIAGLGFSTKQGDSASCEALAIVTEDNYVVRIQAQDGKLVITTEILEDRQIRNCSLF